VSDISDTIEVRRTELFSQRLKGLRVRAARNKIITRIQRVELGNIGDAKFFEGIGELRINYGPGYRVYFVQRGPVVIILLCRWRQIQPGPGHQVGDWDGKGGLIMAIETKPFDAAEYLETEEDIVGYLKEVFEEGDPALIASALGTVARARGISSIAKETGLTRETLYRALSPEGNPTLSTLAAVTKALGFRLSVEPREAV
jgi:probable addiction module antidote protein/putative addiction module killer protein